MFDVKSVVRGGISLKDTWGMIKYNRNWQKENADNFLSFGTIVFCGEMGAGKSLSANRLISDIVSVKEDILVISNTDLYYFDCVPYMGLETIENADNGKRGIICFFDEIQNQFPSTISKELSDDWIKLLSFLRKKHILIVGTAPIFSRLAKPFRESFEYVVLTDNCFFSLIQHNQWFKCNVECKALGDGNEENTHNMRLEKNHYFSRSVRDFKRYDTFETVNIIKSDDRKENKNRR